MVLSHQLQSPLNIWYLDDGVLGVNFEEVFSDLNSIIQLSPSLGLELNFAKCELCFAGMSESSVESTLSKFRTVAPGIQVMQREDATLLGAPLTTEAMAPLLCEKTETLISMVSHLRSLHAHDAVFLLKNCFAIPKLLYLLRTAPAWNAKEELVMVDEMVRQGLQDILQHQIG